MREWVYPSLVDYFDARTDVVAQTAEQLAMLSADDSVVALKSVASDVRSKSEELSDEVLANIAVSFADDIYQTVSWIQQWSAETDAYVNAVFGTFFAVLKERGFVLRYLIDNTYPEHLARPLFLFPRALQAAGLVYSCPHQQALNVMKHEGLFADDSVPSLTDLADGVPEGRYLAQRIATAAAERELHLVYLEIDYQEGTLDAVKSLPAPPGTIVMYRNQAPVPDSMVQVQRY